MSQLRDITAWMEDAVAQVRAEAPPEIAERVDEIRRELDDTDAALTGAPCNGTLVRAVLERILRTAEARDRLASTPSEAQIASNDDDRWYEFMSSILDSTMRTCSGDNPSKLFYGPSCNGMRVVMLQVLESRNFALAGPLNCGDPRTEYTPDEFARTLAYLDKAYQTILGHRAPRSFGSTVPPVRRTLHDVDEPDEWWAIALPLKMQWGVSAHMAGIVVRGGGVRSSQGGLRPGRRVTVYQVDTERYPGHDFERGYTRHQQALLQPFFDLYGFECDEWIYSVCHQDKPQCEGWTTFYSALSAIGFVPSEVAVAFGGCVELERDMMSQLLTVPLQTFRQEVAECESRGERPTIPTLRDLHAQTNTQAVLKLVAQPMLSGDRLDIRGSHPLLVGRVGCERCAAAEALLGDRTPYDAVDTSQIPAPVLEYLMARIRDGRGVAPVEAATVSQIKFEHPIAGAEAASHLDAALSEKRLAGWTKLPLIFMPVQNQDRLQFAGSTEELGLFKTTSV